MLVECDGLLSQRLLENVAQGALDHEERLTAFGPSIRPLERRENV